MSSQPPSPNRTLGQSTEHCCSHKPSASCKLLGMSKFKHKGFPAKYKYSRLSHWRIDDGNDAKLLWRTSTSINDFTLPDLEREVSFAFLREDLKDSSVIPEAGDIINWHEDYYEVDNVTENQLFVGRDKAYNLTNYGEKFGSSLSIICTTHMTRKEATGIDFKGTTYL